MSSGRQSAGENRLLALLLPADFALIEASLEPVEWRRGDVLVEPHQPIEYAYFLTSGLASVIAILPQGRKIEVGPYGREGFGPVSLALGIDQTPFGHTVQVDGAGFRIHRHALRGAMSTSPSLRAMLHNFYEFFSIQTSVTVLTNGSSDIRERLARWLLMCQDRLGSNHLPLTHDFLSDMLGVRRSSVTDAIHVLEGEHCIRAKRAHIEIRDRAKLELVAADSYGLPEAEYERLIGPQWAEVGNSEPLPC